MKRLAALLAIAFAAPAAWAAPLGVQELFDSLSRAKPARAAFHEKKFVALLDKPLESTGELLFTPPSRMEKRTTAPRVESVVVDGDRGQAVRHLHNHPSGRFAVHVCGRKVPLLELGSRYFGIALSNLLNNFIGLHLQDEVAPAAKIEAQMNVL